MRAPDPKDLVLPALCLLVLVAMGVAFPLMERAIVVPRMGLALDGALSDVQQTAIGRIESLGTLMTNWCVALLGAIAVSARSVLGQRGLASWASGIALGLAFVACLVSIWLGMLVTDIVILSLTLDQSPLTSETLHYCRRYQYLAFVSALVLFVFAWLQAAFGPARQPA